jgi:osmoprotectant transport system substrate-binding protein
MIKLRKNAIGAVLGLSLVLAACGDDDDTPSADDTGSDLEGSGELVVGGAQFTEMAIMQEIYKALLEDAGYTVSVETADAREIYAAALSDGQVDVVPEYAATLAEFLNADINGPDAPTESPVATADVAETLEAMAPLAEEFGIVALEPAQASDQNGFAVSQEFSEANGGITTLSQLSALGLPLVMAATEECPERPFCQIGLEAVYGLQFSEILPLGFSSAQTKEATAAGDADVANVGTTDGTLDDYGLVLLEDDQGLMNADNLVPVINEDHVDDEVLASVLNQLADVLTTEDLAQLNAAVDRDRLLPEDVARDYLVEKGLLDE